MAELSGAVRAAAHERVVYEGRAGLVGLLSKNFWLTLITIGIYRFWAATRLRRYLWSNIRIGGDALEYTGTGRELFLGFLIALAVLAPLSIAYIVAYRLTLGNPVLSGSIEIGYFLALSIFLQVALFRSRRYRLSRTSWRGIHAGQTGSTWHYLGLYLGYGVLTVVTLSLALPWMHVALARYKLNHTTFGDSSMRVEASGGAIFWRWLVVLILTILPIALAILANRSSLHAVGAFPNVDDPDFSELFGDWIAFAGPQMIVAIIYIVLGLWLGITLGALALVWYRVEAYRYLASKVQLDTMQLNSAAQGMWGVGQVVHYFLSLIGLAAVTSMVIAGIVIAMMPALVGGGFDPDSLDDNTVGLMVVGILVPTYIILIWLVQVVNYCWLFIPFIKHLTTTLDIANFTAANEIAQSTQPRPKLGIADSFELGAI